jgi:hypothetical protein
VNILSAISDRNLFRPFFGDDLDSWKPWAVALRCLYALPVKTAKAKELVQRCTGRSAETLPISGFSTALFLVGRRSGKSRIAAVIGGFEALFGGHETRLAKGETGIIPIISPTRYQSSIVWKYLHAIFSTPLLKQEVVEEREIEKILVLRNGLEIRILTGDWRTVRGPSVVCAIIDECCFLGLSEESKVRSDSELVRALRPALITTKGKLIAISSKYSRKGWAYGQWLRQHGCNLGVSPSFVQTWTTLVWDSPSKVMNPTLPQSEIDAAYAEDPAAARSEFGGDWRDDVSEYVPRSLVESLVIKTRKELLPRPNLNYFAFSDLSGGRSDAAAIAIAHKEGRKVILDFCRLWRAPFNPHVVVGEQADELKRFGLRRVVGDNYSAEFVKGSFESCGIHYVKAELPKSKLYLELLPRLCSAEIELLDDAVLVDQIAGLERRTRSGGADIVDHPPGGRDDLANCIAGVAVCAGQKKKRVGGLWPAREIGFISRFG